MRVRLDNESNHKPVTHYPIIFYCDINLKLRSVLLRKLKNVFLSYFNYASY